MPSLTFTDLELDDLAERIAVRLVAKTREQLLAGGGIGRGDSTAAGKLLWREEEAANCLGVSRVWLKQMRLRGYLQASTNQKPILYDAGRLEEAMKFILKHRGQGQ